MISRSFSSLKRVTFVFFISLFVAGSGAEVPYPKSDESAAVTDQLNNGDFAGALNQIHVWVNGGQVPWPFWTYWMPILIKTGHNQEAADLALDAISARLKADAFSSVLSKRAEALVNLNKPEDAIQAAKGCYNVSPVMSTEDAIDTVSMCLAKLYPNDKQVVARFRTEQSMSVQLLTNNPTKQDMPANTESILKSIKISDDLYADRIKERESWKTSTDFDKRCCYANLLLVADHASDAENQFRELYQLARSSKELQVAAEGIARSLRAEDGNVGRMNIWLASLQNPKASSQ